MHKCCHLTDDVGASLVVYRSQLNHSHPQFSSHLCFFSIEASSEVEFEVTGLRTPESKLGLANVSEGDEDGRIGPLQDVLD